MNDYKLFNYENINSEINDSHYYSNINLVNGLDNIRPIDDVPDVLHRDDFLEQDIEIDISSNKFREVWDNYVDNYNVDHAKKNISLKDEKFTSHTFKQNEKKLNLDDFYVKLEQLNDYLASFVDVKKESEEMKQYIELSKKEIEQEKELLNIEKEKFEEYKKEETEKINRDKIKFQNMVEEIKNKIDTILG